MKRSAVGELGLASEDRSERIAGPAARSKRESIEHTLPSEALACQGHVQTASLPSSHPLLELRWLEQLHRPTRGFDEVDEFLLDDFRVTVEDFAGGGGPWPTPGRL